MKNYYTNYPVCPYCFEPAIKGYKLIADNQNNYICSNCGNKFKNLVKADSKDDLNILFPLFTKINLNIIELSYLDWILKDDFEGKYFITWPWDTVKFIPILISELIYKNPDEKLVIFYNSKYSKSSEISVLNYKNSLQSLYVINNFNTFNSNNKIELKIQDIFEKNMQGYCKIFVNSLDSTNIKKFEYYVSNLNNISPIFDYLYQFNEFQIPCGFVDADKSCFKIFLEKFKSIFGDELIKKINCSGIEYEYNNDGIFELYFYESYSYQNDLNIRNDIQKSFNECYYNKFELISPFLNKKYCFVDSFDDLDIIKNYDNCSIFFINEELLSNSILNFISTISPKLIISTDIDGLYGKKRYNQYNVISKLLSLNCDVLLFSTNLNRRSFYNIGSPNNFLKKKHVHIHTLDHNDILNHICSKKDILQYSLFSSNIENIHGGSSSLNIKFKPCNELKEIDECIDIIDEIFSKNRDIHDFIEELIRSPLYVGGKTENSFNRGIINIEYLLDIVFNSDEKKWKQLIYSLENVYGYNKEKQKNPLLICIFDLINEYNIPKNKLVVITHHYDYNKLKKIIDDNFGKDEILVTKWNNLNKELKNTSITYAISTEFPTLTYNLYNTPLKELTIVGSPYIIEKYENYKNNRFTNKGTKPIYILSDEEPAPYLLKEALDNIKYDIEDIDLFNEKVNKIIDSSEESEVSNIQYVGNYIKKESNVLLIFDYNHNAMILPFDHYFSILDDKIKHMKISSKNSNYDNILNKKIIINNPADDIFFKFVIENGKNVPIKSKNYVWDNFKDLIESMFEWVDILNKIIKKESKDTSKSINQIKNELVNHIIEIGVTAKTGYYIKNTWLANPKTLETSEGNINIYNAERPWIPEDIYKLYVWISKNYPELSVPSFEAYKSHAAAMKFQDIRNWFFNNNELYMNNDLKKLNGIFQNFIKDRFDDSDLFDVESYSVGKCKQDVRPYVILDEYNDYFKE